MIIFAGSRSKEDWTQKRVYWWRQGEAPQDVEDCYEYVQHSPDGFEWGYTGSGPSQLAFAILYTLLAFGSAYGETMCEKLARDNYMAFKFDIIAGLPEDGWQLSENTIIDWMKARGAV